MYFSVDSVSDPFSLWLNMMYQSPLFTMVRLIKNVVMFPVDVALLYAALKGAERVHRT